MRFKLSYREQPTSAEHYNNCGQTDELSIYHTRPLYEMRIWSLLLSAGEHVAWATPRLRPCTVTTLLVFHSLARGGVVSQAIPFSSQGCCSCSAADHKYCAMRVTTVKRDVTSAADTAASLARSAAETAIGYRPQRSLSLSLSLVKPCAPTDSVIGLSYSRAKL